ncbi:copper chaperone PCu(A)C [Streptomyces sp. SCSIO 30461]|uniref:copper chaperone PCu(A)C n=1 Tax=Streptomyces sp. SCSIO 30461 TaxID=3118085 RepID=UPI0030D4154C
MNRRTAAAIAACLVAAASMTLAGCSSGAVPDGPDIKISGAFMPQPVGDMASGFLTVTNSGGEGDKLTSVTSEIADEVTIHETKGQKMQHVTAFDVPANGELNLERGASHMMFMGLKRQLKAGDNVSVELHFEKSGQVEVELPVKEATYNPKHH